MLAQDLKFVERYARRSAARLARLSPVEFARQSRPFASVMYGGAGIAYALLRASNGLNDSRYLTAASRWITVMQTAASERTAFRAREFGLQRTNARQSSVFFGVAGVHFVAALVAQAREDHRRRGIAVRNFVAAARSRTGAPPELAAGTSGLLLATAHLHAAAPSHERHDLATLGEELYRSLAPPRVRGRSVLGMGHGAAGICLALLEWTAASHRRVAPRLRTSLDALLVLGERRGRSMRWPVAAGVRPKEYMCSWCNGAPGMALLWARAFEMTRQPKFALAAIACGREVLQNPANFSSLCCGLGGQGYALLAVDRIDPFGQWRSKAVAFASRAAAEKVLEPMWRWSLFRGEAGLLCLALDVTRPKTAAFPCIEIETSSRPILAAVG